MFKRKTETRSNMMEDIRILNEEFRSIRKYGRVGMIGGQRHLFTHRDPISGNYWSDDFDKWIDASKIQWV